MGLLRSNALFPDRLASVVGVSFLREVQVETRRVLLADAIVHHVHGGRVLADVDDPCIGLVIEGVVRRFVWTPSGQRVAVAHLRAGDSFGLGWAAGVHTEVGTLAVTDASVAELDSMRIARAILIDAGFGRLVAAEVAGELTAILRALQDWLGASVRRRLARVLLELSSGTRPDDRCPVQLNVRRDELADAVGTAREVISRNLASLARDGVIDIAGSRVSIVDRDALRRVSGEREAAGSGARDPGHATSYGSPRLVVPESPPA